jgi:hypothetical protein
VGAIFAWFGFDHHRFNGLFFCFGRWDLVSVWWFLRFLSNGGFSARLVGSALVFGAFNRSVFLTCPPLAVCFFAPFFSPRRAGAVLFFVVVWLAYMLIGSVGSLSDFYRSFLQFFAFNYLTFAPLLLRRAVNCFGLFLRPFLLLSP